ncbi:hypothetical protein [Streptomyces sp. NPDC001828]
MVGCVAAGRAVRLDVPCAVREFIEEHGEQEAGERGAQSEVHATLA